MSDKSWRNSATSLFPDEFGYEYDMADLETPNGAEPDALLSAIRPISDDLYDVLPYMHYVANRLCASDHAAPGGNAQAFGSRFADRSACDQ